MAGRRASRGPPAGSRGRRRPPTVRGVAGVKESRALRCHEGGRSRRPPPLGEFEGLVATGSGARAFARHDGRCPPVALAAPPAVREGEHTSESTTTGATSGRRPGFSRDRPGAQRGLGAEGCAPSVAARGGAVRGSGVHPRVRRGQPPECSGREAGGSLERAAPYGPRLCSRLVRGRVLRQRLALAARAGGGYAYPPAPRGRGARGHHAVGGAHALVRRRIGWGARGGAHQLGDTSTRCSRRTRWRTRR